VKILVTARSGAREFECEPDEKILHAGLRSGIELPYECGTGTCGTCKARLVSGRVESEWPDAPGSRYLKDPAELLMCQCVAREDCALEVGGLKSSDAGAWAPGALGGRVRDRRRLTHDVAAFDVELDRPLDFAAGQFALLTVPGIRAPGRTPW
jgi:toluene monooxygenase electron transfer component